MPVAPELEPAAPDQTVQAPDGVTVRLAQVEHVEGEAVAAGETSGPAVRLTVEVTNGTDAPLDLSYAVVNAYTGEDRAPAGRLVQPGGQPFEGELARARAGRASSCSPSPTPTATTSPSRWSTRRARRPWCFAAICPDPRGKGR